MRTDAGLLVLRVGIGLSMLSHGIPKAMKLVEYPPHFADPLGIGVVPSLLLAIFAELVCSVLLVLGVWTRLAAIPLLVTMCVAFFLVQRGEAWGTRELAAIYGIVFASLIFLGGGRHSLGQRFN